MPMKTKKSADLRREARRLRNKSAKLMQQREALIKQFLSLAEESVVAEKKLLTLSKTIEKSRKNVPN
jgi:hypothetical protein